jgi:hypothetical protein
LGVIGTVISDNSHPCFMYRWCCHIRDKRQTFRACIASKSPAITKLTALYCLEMPRLTTKQYLTNHVWLRNLWLGDRSRFAELTANEQWHLHAFYLPSEDWPDDKLLELRQAATFQNPSLPQAAGRALAKLKAAPPYHERGPIVRTGKPQHVTAVSVQVLVHPKPDYAKLARAVLRLAKEMHDEQGGDKAA